MAPAWLKARQTKYSAFAFLYIAVVVGVLVFANVFADRYNKSYDSTANKQFSLSEQTIKIVKGLKADTELTYFGSDFTEARDTLDRYASLSPKVHARYMDPDRKPQEARAAGFRSDSPVVVDVGSRREGAKSLTENARYACSPLRASTQQTSRMGGDTRTLRRCSSERTTKFARNRRRRKAWKPARV